MTRTLLLGLDGLDPGLVADFDLPNIEAIGEHRTIDTHGNSGPSWASVMTGLTPDGHGVQKLNPQLDQQSWQGTPIWEKVDGYSGVANVPMTYPPDTGIDGWMVTGMMTPSNAIYTYPRQLKLMLDDLGYRVDIWVGDHENHPDGHYGTVPFEFTQEYRDELLSEADDVLDRRTEAYSWLLANQPTDFTFLVYTVLDRVQHLAFDEQDVIEVFYRKVDAHVGKLLDRVGEGTEVIACSDHGFRRLDVPGVDLAGEHRIEGWAATNFEVDRALRNLEDVHRVAVESANRSDVERRLDDLGYLE